MNIPKSTLELTGMQLDYAMWMAAGMFNDDMYQGMTPKQFKRAWWAENSKYDVHPSSSYCDGHLTGGGHFMDVQGIDTSTVFSPERGRLKTEHYVGKTCYNLSRFTYDVICKGSTRLEAAARCYVYKMLGKTVPLPEEIC